MISENSSELSVPWTHIGPETNIVQSSWANLCMSERGRIVEPIADFLCATIIIVKCEKRQVESLFQLKPNE